MTWFFRLSMLALVLNLSLISPQASAAPIASTKPAAIILIRHAEKPDQGAELSERGWQRAQALPSLFRDRAEFSKFGAPAALFAMAPKDQGGSVRAIQTLKYVSSSFGVSINDHFTKKKSKDLATTIFSDQTLIGRLVVICWDHDFIDNVAEALGVSHAPKYPDDRFDRAWLVTFDNSGNATLKDLPQKLLDGDTNQ